MNQGLIQPADAAALAVLDAHGRRISYAQLSEDVGIVAQRLQPGSLVGLIGRNDYPFLLHYLACLERGAVPLLLSADWSPAHLANYLNRFSPASVLLPDTLVDLVSGYQRVHQAAAYQLWQAREPVPIALHPELAVLLTTSGSTGSPKLVRLSRQNLLSNADAIRDYLGIDPAERGSAALPLSYSYGLSIINSHLRAGACVVLSNGTMMQAAFWQQMRTAQVTSLAGVPYHYEMLLRLGLGQLDWPELRSLTQAGGRLSAARLKRLYAECRQRGLHFWTMYGQTEASPRISYLAPEAGPDKIGSIGHAVPGGRLWLVTEQGHGITTPGQVGELRYAGPNVCLGYASTPADLARGDDFGGVLTTGDLAHCDADGDFYLVGRSKRFLKIAGKRISLDQIEAACGDLGWTCIAGGDDLRLQLQVESATEQDVADLRQQVARLAGIHPSAVQVAATATLPRLPTGKLDYRCVHTATTTS